MDKFDDMKLLDYETYEDYLDSFVTKEDHRYLRNSFYARQLVQLGYKSTSEILTKKKFLQRKHEIHETLFPSKKWHLLISRECESTDPFLEELALRERPNRTCLLSTIIFLRHKRKNGREISGYIDFEQSLRDNRQQKEDATDWHEVFHNNKRLWPTEKDLGFYNWHTKKSVTNDSDNYKVVVDPIQGLTFISKHDHKYILVDPTLEQPGNNTTRTLIYSTNYTHVVLYDHVVRQKI